MYKDKFMAKGGLWDGNFSFYCRFIFLKVGNTIKFLK